jgi:hypothetical protein
MKQTAVEWLVEKLNKIYGNHDFLITFQNEISEAIEMEKHQIIDAKDCWFEDERDGEQYYSETYKK